MLTVCIAFDIHFVRAALFLFIVAQPLSQTTSVIKSDPTNYAENHKPSHIKPLLITPNYT